MIRPRNLIAITALATLSATLLTGCFGSSPEIRYYALSTEAVEPTDKDISLSIGPFELPDYLNRPQIVTRGNNQRIKLKQYDRWAESLEKGISRRIAASVSRQNENIFVYEFIRTSSFTGDYRVFGLVTKFEADQSNTVTLEVDWAIVRVRRDSALADVSNEGMRSVYTRTIASSSDINEVTNTMGELLDEFSTDIARKVDDRIDRDAKADALESASE